MKFITAELHTATIERTKRSESDDTSQVGETDWMTSSTDAATATSDPDQADQAQTSSADERGTKERDRAAKRMQKEEEFFRLFLHFGSYSAPSLATPTAQRPRANTGNRATVIPKSKDDNYANNSNGIAAPPVFDDQRECRFFNKRKRAEVIGLSLSERSSHTHNPMLLSEILRTPHPRAHEGSL